MARITNKEINLLDKYFRLSNYLSVGQLYLMDNPLLKRKLELKDIKPNVVGHWGTAPGQNFIYTHLNRIIKKYNLNMIYISGPGHGGQALVSHTYIEGSYTKIYPNITEDENGLKKLFKQFSFPGGVSSHVAPETPGSINEGGELGYSLAHAYGAVLDNPDLIAACIIGDGEAETGPLAASWQINKIMNPKNDGIVLPILHLNGYKIANPTILSRIPNDELLSYFKGCGYRPFIVDGNDPKKMHKKMAKVLDEIIEYIKKIKEQAETHNFRPFYPMIILRTPKGWTGPKEVEGTYKSHQVPIIVNKENEANVRALEKWLKSYKPNELFNSDGSIKKDIKTLIPPEERRMGINPVTNGGLILKELKTPGIINYGIEVKERGQTEAEDMRELGYYIRDLITLNEDNKNYRIFGPDEALSNRLNHVFEATNKKWGTKITRKDELLNKNGRVIDGILSEHVCEGMLEGYILTGRHGFIHSYEAFIRIIDSMASQHAKWLKVTKELPWRKPISSLNYVLASHVWQQDHNGYTHQDPGFINHIITKKSDIVRIYLPFDTNTLISTFDHITKTKNYINLVIASKHKRPQWLTMEEAIEHCRKGIGILPWASTYKGKNPDIILACAGDTPTVEVLAAVSILKEKLPTLKIRVVNVVDLMRLESKEKHPHGLTDEEYDNIFTIDKPIIFAFHGYPTVIHQLTYNRKNKNMHVRGYNEEGTITTPFDMRVQNKIDRYHLILDVLSYVPKLKKENELKEYCENMLKKHHNYIRKNGKEMNEISKWKWNS
jgi:xylulose-5-phosphate/fructose-6-phosphate phosphoketolase